jgi:hypothetical protein
MKTVLKSITLLTPLVFLGCAETNNPKPTKATVEQVYDANNVPRVVVPPSMRHGANNAWSKIANALKLDDKAKRSFGNLNNLFSDISTKIMSNNYSDEQLYELIKANNGKVRKTSNSQRPYQFYYTQKLDNGVLFVVFTSSSNIGSITLNPSIKKVGSTSNYKKAYHISFDISGHKELNRETSTLTLFSDNSKTYSSESDRMRGGPNYSGNIYKVYAIVGSTLYQLGFDESATDPIVRAKCERIKYKQQCYDSLIKGRK